MADMTSNSDIAERLYHAIAFSACPAPQLQAKASKALLFCQILAAALATPISVAGLVSHASPESLRLCRNNMRMSTTYGYLLKKTCGGRIIETNAAVLCFNAPAHLPGLLTWCTVASLTKHCAALLIPFCAANGKMTARSKLGLSQFPCHC